MKKLLKELNFQLTELHFERIDKDDFINGIEEIYWKFKSTK